MHGPYLVKKIPLEKERWKPKWWNWEVFQMMCGFLAQSRLSTYVCLFFFLSLSLVLLPPILSLRQSATAALFCAKGDIEVDPWSPGETRLSVSLPQPSWHYVAHGGQGQSREWRSVSLAHDTLGLVCGREWMSWTRDWANSYPVMESARGN